MTVQEPTFLILTALAAGPLHGYGVMREVEALSPDRGRLRAGTLYAALDRLTEPGAAALDAEIARMRKHASTAAARLRARHAT